MGIHTVLSYSFLIHHVEKQVNELGDSSMLYKFFSPACLTALKKKSQMNVCMCMVDK